MALDLGELVATLAVDERGWTRPMRQAEQSVNRLESRSSGSLDRMEDDFGEAGRGAARELGRGLDRAADEAERAGRETGQRFVRGADGRLRDTKGRFVREGRRAGEGFGDAAEREIRKSDLGSAGKKAGESAGEGLADGAESGSKGKFGALRGKLSGVMAKAGPWLAAGAVVGGVFMSGLAGAMEKQDALAKLKAQVGGFGPSSAVLGKAAGALYAKGYGESMGDVADGIRAVVQNLDGMKNASASTLTQMGARAMDVADIMDEDVGAVMRAVSQMLRTGMAKNAKEAFDIITIGAQNSSNKAEDLLDTFNEYSTQFRRVGLDGKTALALIRQGLQAGARDSDQVADAIGQFGERALAGGTAVDDAFKSIGLNSGTMAKMIGKGGDSAKLALTQTMNALRGTKDEQTKLNAAAALFGDPGNVLGAALFALDPSGKAAAAALGKVEGAADKAGQTLHSSASANIEKFQRTLKGKLVDLVGGKVLPALTELSDKVGPIFQKGLGKAKKWIEENQDKIQEWSDKIEQIMTLIGGIIDSGLTVVGVLWDKFGSTILDTISGLVDGILGYWVGIFTMIQGVWNVFAGIFTGDWGRVWDGIKQIFSGAIKAVGSILGIGLTLIKATWKFTWELIKKYVKKAWDNIVAGVKWGAKKVVSAVGWFASLPGRVAGWFGRMKDAAVNRAQSLASWMRGLPGRIKRALGNLGSLLWGSGRKVISGLINGIKSKIGDVGGTMSRVVQEIRDRLPFSPAKKGPLSGSGSPDIAGEKIGLMLAAGVTSSRSRVAAAMDGVTGVVGAAQSSAFTVRRPGGGSVVRGGDGAAQELRVIWDIRGGDRKVKEWVRETVRVEGRGNVQVAFGQRGR